MRILLVNKFHYFRGGSEKYYFELAKLLKEHGHTVGYFSMKNENNITTGDKEYFVEEIDMNTGSKLKAFDVIYSPANKKLMTKALEEFKPDIVHINNFQRQLSASIIDAIKEKNIPIVMTAHDLNPICPASVMLYDGQICEDCMKNGYMSCIKKSCIKDSRAKSLIGVLEYEFYKLKKVWSKIDTIITPSEFLKTKLKENGINNQNIVAIHNFVNETNTNDCTIGDYALYVGRLSAEKGILNLLEAINKVDNAKLVIAGDGPERESIETYIKENHLENRISLVGYQNQEGVKQFIKNSKFVIVPSIWYENCPYSILETMEIGKPVIASKIGGIPELIKNDINGFLYPYDNIDALADCISKLFGDEQLIANMSSNAKNLFKTNYTAEVYYNKIISVYNQLV